MPTSRSCVLSVWIALVLNCALSLAKPLPADPADYEVGKKYTAPMTRMRPTQFAVGKNEVLFRERHIERLKLADPALYKAYLREKRPKVVIGPEGELYVVDGHHFLTALRDLGVEEVDFEVLENWSDKPLEKFWKNMIRKGYTLLKDTDYQERSWQDLPKYISRLKDDPYRTLAWMTQKAGAWEDMGIPFQEFFWGEFYREHISLPKNPTDEDMLRAVRKAIKISRKRKASDLPGYQRYEKAFCNAMLSEVVDLVP